LCFRVLLRGDESNELISECTGLLNGQPHNDVFTVDPADGYVQAIIHVRNAQPRCNARHGQYRRPRLRNR
jgi:hypothetical protein